MSFNSFIRISGVETHVACWGKWIEEDIPDEVIICIPGNPGLAGFYYPYLEELHQNTKLPVWILGHAGHDKPDVRMFGKIQPIEGNGHLFDLNGQFVHKEEFIRKFTKPNTKIHLLGHSIGAWIALELLKKELSDRIVSVNLLFPTIQHLAQTPNGQFLNNTIRQFPFIIWMLLWFFSKLPMILKIFLINIYNYFNGIPKLTIFNDTILRYMTRPIIEKVLFMAFDEMDKVKELDITALKANKRRIKIIYGNVDNWAPVQFFIDLKAYIPDLYMKNVSYQHAFCMTAFSEMAALTADLIN